MDTLLSARLRDTLYGTVVIELMAVQDLFMAPLLAIPTALSHIVWQKSPAQLVKRVVDPQGAPTPTHSTPLLSRARGGSARFRTRAEGPFLHYWWYTS